MISLPGRCDACEEEATFGTGVTFGQESILCSKHMRELIEEDFEDSPMKV